MSDEVQWEDPPPDTRNAATADHEFAKALRSRPGEWAYYGEVTPSKVSAINHGTVTAFYPRGHYKATSRGVPDSKPARVKVWARYVPEEERSP